MAAQRVREHSMSLTTFQTIREFKNMAITIGSQLDAKLEEIMHLQRVMSSLASIGTGIRKFEDFEGFANVVEFIEATQNKALDEFQIFVKRQVLPIVAHINDGV